jgi:hypothetical protein
MIKDTIADQKRTEELKNSIPVDEVITLLLARMSKV